jgi:ubiquitin C-terminal hydrolase
MNDNIGISKFVNINGVTCYMNSILTILQQTPLFSDWIINLNFKPDLLKKYKDKDINDSILYNFYTLLTTSLQANYNTITPTSFRNCISKLNSMWGENQHQDSQELLIFIFTKLEEDICKNITIVHGREDTKLNNPPLKNLKHLIAQSHWEMFIKKEFSPIKILFTGMFHNSIKCSKCNNESNRFELFQNIQLSISNNSNSLYDLFDNYTVEEQLDKDNLLKCDFCFVKNQSKKKISLWKLPKILIIQMKRFKFNQYGLPSMKLENFIDYPLYDLDLNKYVNSGEKAQYNLFAVNLHHNLGFGLNYGHYTSLVKNRINNKWYHYNDEKPIEEIKNIDKIINKNAYLLFYYKIN